MYFKNGDLITAVDIVDNILEFDSPLAKGSYPSFTATIQIVTATVGIRFSSGEPIQTTGFRFNTFQDKIVIGFIPSERALHFQADTIGDSFVITVS